MKINPTQASKALGVYQTQKQTGVKEPKKNANVKDNVSISDLGQSFQLALKAVKESPEIRTAKVEEIKVRLNQGNYKVSSSLLAEKMIQDALMSKKG